MLECLMDSGVVVSAVRFSASSNSVRDRICRSNVQVMGANGSPLHVMGTLNL